MRSNLNVVEGSTISRYNVGCCRRAPLFSDPRLREPISARVAYDVSADGRPVMADSAESENEEQEPPSIQVTLNRFEGFPNQE
jgi:hypothetical protein